ncbi:MAG: nucleoside triphosphate pyrophosphatase [candidate division WOR-3 bacterium]
MLYLASVSPRRQELLSRLGLRFRQLEPAVCEEELLAKLGHSDPARFARTAARAKAWSVIGQVRKGLIIGVDTVVVVRGTILGKPRTRADARQMLALLSNRTHRVISGVAVVRRPDNRTFAGTETTLVRFRRLGSSEIDRYVRTPEPYDKAGAYGIQEAAGVFVARVNGCYLNVVGLPVTLLLKLLGRAGYRLMRST